MFGTASECTWDLVLNTRRVDVGLGLFVSNDTPHLLVACDLLLGWVHWLPRGYQVGRAGALLGNVKGPVNGLKQAISAKQEASAPSAMQSCKKQAKTSAHMTGYVCSHKKPEHLTLFPVSFALLVNLLQYFYPLARALRTKYRWDQRANGTE
jgi:hypothetical protein